MKWIRSLQLGFAYLAAIVLVSSTASSRANQAQLKFALCMLIAQLPTLALKIVSKRLRPVVADAHWLNVVTVRRLLGVHESVNTPKEARESFPSGDAVGAGVFYGVLACSTDSSLWLIPVVITLFGRVYFWAHHIGDVSVGCIIGLSVSYVLHAIVGDMVLTLWHFLGVLAAFMLVWHSLSKLRGKVHPRDELVVDKVEKAVEKAVEKVVEKAAERIGRVETVEKVPNDTHKSE